MPDEGQPLIETITLSQAKALIKCLAHDQSLLFLSPPGVGKSESVMQAAEEVGMPCRSLLGTQIAPEDVSGIPQIVGERSVFCPPRILLPENPTPFCLFLDELPACPPDIQKAFYSLLLERRLGEHYLPKGSWVVAAGNRAEDRALVRTISSALVNRVVILNVRVDVKEWLIWAKANGVRSEILAFITYIPAALMRAVPRLPVPFSTPRAWASLSRALDLIDKERITTNEIRRALAFGRVSAEDAALFCAMAEEKLGELRDVEDYLRSPSLLPESDTARWFIINRIRQLVQRHEFPNVGPEITQHFLEALPNEFRFALLVDLVEQWSNLGATGAMFDALAEVTGL
jgi:MoxR-like ATPase